MDPHGAADRTDKHPLRFVISAYNLIDVFCCLLQGLGHKVCFKSSRVAWDVSMWSGAP